MSTPVKGFWVAIDENLPAADAQQVATAIALIRGVVGVEMCKACGSSDSLVRMRVEDEWRAKLLALIRST